MHPQILRPRFEPETRHTPLRTDRVLNYVWMNRRKPGETLYSVVPMHYFDKAFHNAWLYPDTQVNIWVAMDRLNKHTRDIMRNHVAFHAPGNVRVRDLNDIPAYTRSPVFGNGPKRYAIAIQIDFMRFHVLSHCLKSTLADKVFYADFDVENVQLDNEKTAKVLNDKGIVYGAVKSDNFFGGKIIAHGYIAAARRGQVNLDKVLMPVLEDSALSGENLFHGINDVTFGDADFLERLELMEQVTTDVPIHPIGWVMPVDPSYIQAGLCSPTFRREGNPAYRVELAL